MPPSAEVPDFDIDALLRSVDATIGAEQTVVSSNGSSHNGEVTPAEALDAADLVSKILSEQVVIVPEVITEPPAPEPEVGIPAAVLVVPAAPKPKRTPRRARSDSETGQSRRGRIDDPEADLVKLYLTEIAQYPLLDKEGEVKLAQTYEQGIMAAEELKNPTEELTAGRKRELRRLARDGELAEREFVNSNLRLVVSIAKRYQASGLPLLDLIQEGNFGLMHAVEKFDWRKGFKFSTYATWWIKQSITRGIANTGRPIRLPVHAGDDVNRLIRANAKLALNILDDEEASRGFNIAKLAAELEWSEQKVKDVIEWHKSGSQDSLDEPLTDDVGSSTRGDLTADPKSGEAYEAAMRDMDISTGLGRALETLNIREQKILRKRFGLDGDGEKTLEEVGKDFNLTRERIRQIESRALSKLRHPSNRLNMSGAQEYAQGT